LRQSTLLPGKQQSREISLIAEARQHKTVGESCATNSAENIFSSSEDEAGKNYAHCAECSPNNFLNGNTLNAFIAWQGNRALYFGHDYNRG